MSLEYDVRAARRAVEDLAASVAALRRHYGEHVDLARLAADTERVGHDLDLLAGPEPTEAAPTPIEIPPEDYPPEFFADADDEGIGRR